MESGASLWHGRKFTPLWLSQTLSALNDNLFRYSFNAALMFGIIALPETQAKFWVSLSAAFFILPYLLFSGIAGQIADRYPKASLLRINRLIEIFVFGLASIALDQKNIPLLLISLLLTGTAAAFYSPVKYALPPELVAPRQLLAANAAMEAGVYMAILLGTIAGTSIIMTLHYGTLFVIISMLLIALIAWFMSLLIPDVPVASPNLKIDWLLPRQIWQLICWGARDQLRMKLLLGHAWFWFIGAALLSQITIFVKDDLRGGPELNTLFLALFALGIGVGGWLCARLLKGNISLKYVSHAAFFMSGGCILLGAIAYLQPAKSPVMLLQFLTSFRGWTVALMFLTAAAAGLYVVPIISKLQLSVPEDQRARLLALANIWFAIFVMASSLLATSIIALGGSAREVMVAIGILTLPVALSYRGEAAYNKSEVKT